MKMPSFLTNAAEKLKSVLRKKPGAGSAKEKGGAAGSADGPRTAYGAVFGYSGSHVYFVMSGEKGIEGEIVDCGTPTQWPEKTKALLEAHHVKSSAKTAAVLFQPVYHAVQIEKPKVPDEEMMNALPFAVKDFITQNPAEQLFDYVDCLKIASTPDRIQVFSAPKKDIDGIAQTLSSMTKLQLITVDQLAMADLFGTDQTVQVILFQPERHDLTLSVYQQGINVFSRTVRGYMNLTKVSFRPAQRPAPAPAPAPRQPGVIDIGSLAGELRGLEAGNGAGQPGGAPAAAPAPAPEDPEKPYIPQQSDLLDGLSLEIQRSLDYLTAQLKLPPVRKMFFAIDSKELGTIMGYLKNFFSVELVDLRDMVKGNTFEYLPLVACLNGREEKA